MKFAHIALTSVLALSFASFAEETLLEKGETAKNKTVDAVKKTYRKGKNEVCEMVNGKMECLAKKVGNKVKDGADALGTKATEVKNKAD